MQLTPAECTALRQKHYNATVVALQRPHEELMVVRIRPDFPVPLHTPGQYGTLGMGYWEARAPDCQEEEIKPADMGRLVRRAYSLSCSVLDDDGQLLELTQKHWIEFYIVLVRHAEKRPPALTPRLFLLEEGSRLFLGEKITGHYNLDAVQPGDSVVFLSTGTGEAPHNYLLWELLRRNHEGRILAACCVRYQRDLGYHALHQELMRRHPHYTYLSLTTREAANVGHKVYIQDLISSGQLEERLGAPLDPARTHVYLCGNPKMIGAPVHDRSTNLFTFPQPTGVVEILSRRGFKMDQPAVKFTGNIHVEEYW
jgi:ferredoxin/flavodoxin---NADP+ reductase